MAFPPDGFPHAAMCPTDAAPGGWVDVHNHLLPGLDDGPRDWDQALRLCRALVHEGVTHAAATPHLFGPYAEPDRVERIVEAGRELARRVDEARLPLTLYLGADTRIDGVLSAALTEGRALPLGRGGRYVLIEPPHDVWVEAPGVCEALASAGYAGVLTHPERHPHLRRRGVAALQPWIDRGAVIQVTAGSLTGDFGPEAEALAWEIAAAPVGVPVIVASDAHDVTRRPPRMAEAARQLAVRLGPAVAERLCRTLPWQLLADAVPLRARAAQGAQSGDVAPVAHGGTPR